MQRSCIFVSKKKKKNQSLISNHSDSAEGCGTVHNKIKYMIYDNRVGTIILMLGVCSSRGGVVGWWLWVQTSFLLFERKGYAFSCYNP
jgi:hypothetical protein